MVAGVSRTSPDARSYSLSACRLRCFLPHVCVFFSPVKAFSFLLASFQTTLSIGPSCPSRSLYTGGTPLIFRIYSLVSNLARYRIIFLSASSQCSPYRRTHRLSSSPTSWWSPAAARRASPARSIYGVPGKINCPKGSLCNCAYLFQF